MRVAKHAHVEALAREVLAIVADAKLEALVLKAHLARHLGAVLARPVVVAQAQAQRRQGTERHEVLVGRDVAGVDDEVAAVQRVEHLVREPAVRVTQNVDALARHGCPLSPD